MGMRDFITQKEFEAIFEFLATIAQFVLECLQMKTLTEPNKLHHKRKLFI